MGDDLQLKACATAMHAAKVCTYCDVVLTPTVGVLLVCSVMGAGSRVVGVVSAICFACVRDKPERWQGMAWMSAPSRESAE